MMLDSREVLLSGTIIYGDDLEIMEGHICIRDGLIKEVGHERVEADFVGLICPRFINAHTHIGDSVFKDPPFLPLFDLVGPSGLKHRILRETGAELMIEGMRRTLRYMMNTGTFAFADFREGGGAGIDLMLEAQKGMPLTSRILGRPIDGSIDMHELCWGLGISSARDYDIKRLEEMVDLARAGHKVIAIHAGEAGRDDISSALSLGPDFLVHLCSAYDEDLQRIAALDLPVVVCPRSNLMTGAGLPDVKRMVDLGMTVGVGTDNVMLNSPNIFREMEILSKAILHDDGQVFKMCTLNGAKILGIDKTTGSISEGKDGRVMVIDMRSNNLWGSANPLASLVRRAEPSDILAVF